MEQEENKPESKNARLEEEKSKTDTEKLEPTIDSTNFFGGISSIPKIEEIINSISNAVNSWSQNRPLITKYTFCLTILTLVFGILVLAATGKPRRSDSTNLSDCCFVHINCL